MKFKSTVLAGTVFLSALITSGCATSNPAVSSTHAQPLQSKNGAKVDLTKYRIATVVPFSIPQNKDIDPSIGAKFANDIAIRLQYDFGNLFDQVREGTPLNQTNELIIGGIITTYEPGDKFERAMLIGLGAASFKGELDLKDATGNETIFAAPFDKLWAWGGFLGMSKDINDMQTETEASIADTIARAKGWQPPADTQSKVKTGK